MINPRILLVTICALIALPAFAAREDIVEFCTNIADPARERRYALKQAELERLRAAIEERMTALETRRNELEAWVVKREQFVDQARKSLVGIYARMRPDAAAERLANLSDDLAAAIIIRMKPAKAGVILNEMKPAKAAALSAFIAASGATAKPVSPKS